MMSSGSPATPGLGQRTAVSVRPLWRSRVATALVVLATLGSGWHFVTARAYEGLAAVDAALAAEVVWQRAQIPEQFDSRDAVVAALEQHVLQTAGERHLRGFYPSATLYASCVPDLGSPNAADDTVTTFSCLAVTGNGDTAKNAKPQVGYAMPAMINWSTGEFSWR